MATPATRRVGGVQEGERLLMFGAAVCLTSGQIGPKLQQMLLLIRTVKGVFATLFSMYIYAYALAYILLY